MTVTAPIDALLSAEACAARRKAGLMDDQGHFDRSLAEQAIVEGFIGRIAGVTGVAAKVLQVWLDAAADGGEA